MKKLLLLLVFSILFSGAQGLMAGSALAEEEKVLNVYAWSEYLPQESIETFEEKYGIKVVYSTYDSNEAMFAKLKLLDGKGYDLVIPSTYFITQMKNEGVLSKIDKSKLSNFGQLKKNLIGLDFDPENEYSIPYLWGSSGIQVNKNHIDPAGITSWADLARPEFAGRVLMPDDMRDAMGIALMALGYSSNSVKEEEIKAAYEWLSELKPNVRVFSSNNAIQPMAVEETWIGAIWNGEAYLAWEENDSLEFIYPKEGGVVWIDSFVIPSGAEHPENAHLFIDFMINGENGALAVDEFRYSTASEDAQALLPKELQNSNVISPTAEDLKGSEITVNIGNATAIYEKYWELFRTGTNIE
ncbi:MAG: spermidine/putrescine ABC transporter substrate-binding protein [Desulfovibrionaceae bacterium]|nr:spermidine/putrescine ABC transporter substrate-binding protein [Desulfovibrionaceae bacterium]